MLLSPDYNIRRMQNIKPLRNNVLTCAVCYNRPQRARRGLPSLSGRIGGRQTAVEGSGKQAKGEGEMSKKRPKEF